MRYCLQLLIMLNCLQKTFLRTLILMTQVSLPTFPSKTTLKLYDVHVTLQLVKQMITNLDFSKVSDCMVVLVLKKCEPKLLDIVAELFNMCLTKSKLLEVLISGQCI